MRVGIGLEGRFMLEAINPETGERRSSGWFDNLILNNGLDVMGTVAPTGVCRVGTSGNPVDVSLTSLVAGIATTNAIQSNTYGWDTVGNLYGWNRRVFRFAAGVATGTLQEVGVSYSVSSGMFSRALITDSVGTPTPFVVGPGDLLDVTYELRYYPKITDTVTVINIDGTDYTFTIRPFDADTTFASATHIRFLGAGGDTIGMEGLNSSTAYAYSTLTSFGDYLSSMTASGSALSTSVSVDAYVTGSYEITHNWTFGPANGSSPFVAFWFPSACGIWKAQVSPPIPKDNTKSFTIKTKISWGRRT